MQSLPTLSLFAVVSVMLTAFDARDLRLPDRTLWPGTLVVIASDITSQTLIEIDSIDIQETAVITVMVTTGVWLMRQAAPRSVGLGDVKLMPLVTWMVHSNGGLDALLLYSVIVAVMLMAAGIVTKLRAQPGTLIPAGPALLLGTWAIIIATHYEKL